jgi:hypothetical protein
MYHKSEHQQGGNIYVKKNKKQEADSVPLSVLTFTGN